ncbi:hypothetical protein NHQ30_000307 [Ciborinia camelliae]|nr:hypothetical protein NHQ30_000307 [Ciborinia camelliae]
MLKLLIVWFALLVLVRDKVTGQSTTTSSAAMPTHTVSVGAEGLQFTPKELSADVGDVIVVVNDTDPIFFYCSAPEACRGNGMIGVVNANSTQTFENQYAFAKNTLIQFNPGENFPVEASSSTSTTNPTSTSTPTQSSASPATILVTDPSPSSASPTKLSPGAIAGIAIGASALVLLASALLYLCGRQRTIKEIIHHNSRSPNMASQLHPHHPLGPNSQSYMPPSASLSETTYYSKPRHLMTANEIRGLGQFSGAGSDHHSHLSESNVGSEGYGGSRSRSPGADEYGMSIPPLNLPNGGSGNGNGNDAAAGAGAGTGRGGSRSPSHQLGNPNASLPNSPWVPGVQMGTVERWEGDRERDRVESERLSGLRPSPSPGPPNRFHSNTSPSGPHELATHHDEEGPREGEGERERARDRYDDPEM